MDTHKSGEAVMSICGILACGSLPSKAGAPHCETFDSFFPPLYFIHSEHVVICVCVDSFFISNHRGESGSYADPLPLYVS